jgi:hypothetical protein
MYEEEIRMEGQTKEAARHALAGRGLIARGSIPAENGMNSPFARRRASGRP